ncbi:DUF2397 family protein [Streptomyces diastatochromogenes]|nr:DUF2397 family protein [Streptomyces diastatochromogenes]
MAARAADREAATDLLDHGPHDRVLSEAETRAVLKLLTRALQARTVVAGRLRSGTGSSDVLTLRLVPNERGSQLRTETGTLHLPGFALEIKPHGSMRRRRTEKP